MRLCVISIDAMVCEDVPLLLSMKNCAELFKHSARVEQLETVYPSLTHPVHAALLTGCRCGKNGVTHNERFDPFHHVPVWYNQLSDIRCDTIFHAARRAGLHSCAARWPMTACGNGIIDYIVPEVLDADLQNGKSMRDVLAAADQGLFWKISSTQIFAFWMETGVRDMTHSVLHAVLTSCCANSLICCLPIGECWIAHAIAAVCLDLTSARR